MHRMHIKNESISHPALSRCNSHKWLITSLLPSASILPSYGLTFKALCSPLDTSSSKTMERVAVNIVSQFQLVNLDAVLIREQCSDQSVILSILIVQDLEKAIRKVWV